MKILDRKRRFQLELLERRENPSGPSNFWGAAHLTPDHTQLVAYFGGTATTKVEAQAVAPDGTTLTSSTVTNGFSNVLYSFLGQINAAITPSASIAAVATLDAHQLLSSSVPPDNADTITLGINGQLSPISGGRERLTGSFEQLSGTGQFAATTAHGLIGANLLPNGVTKIRFYGKIYRS